jgi:hypothetical protein
MGYLESANYAHVPMLPPIAWRTEIAWQKMINDET